MKLALLCYLERFFASLFSAAAFYLPESWADDPARCDKAGIPADERKFLTNPEIALSNVAADEDPRRLVSDGVERNFRDAKSEVGKPDEESKPLDRVH